MSQRHVSLTFQLTLKPMFKEAIPKEEEGSFAKNLQAMYEDKEFADFKFIVAGEEILAHKVVLGGENRKYKILYSCS